MSGKRVPPPSDGDTLPGWANDKKASLEDKKWADEDALKGQKSKNDMLWLRVYGVIVPSMMVIFTLLYVSVLIIYAWHYVTPYVWLTAEQLSKIQSVIFSGSVGAFVASVIKKHS